ncbi:MAG: esterase [Planctomycetaceae bacterium]|nr:esterase [Planctomycetaceae bacterium]
MRAFSLIGLVLLLSGLALAADPPAPKPWDWMIDGDRREALVVLPETPSDTPAPLVFAFHGHGGNMEGFGHRVALRKHWPEAIAVYMQGLPTPSRLDPQGKKPGWQTQTSDATNRDLKFLDTVLATLRKKHAIDEDRIYATGFSNGGGFTYLLWSARPKLFAAYAPCAAILREPENSKLEPAPILHIAGERDQVALFEMQLKTMAKVREINGCQEIPVEWGLGGKLYPSKTKAGAPFASLIHPGGHIVPNHSIEMIVKFFKEHPRQR